MGLSGLPQTYIPMQKSLASDVADSRWAVLCKSQASMQPQPIPFANSTMLSGIAPGLVPPGMLATR
jgi:hypothetical protein